MPLSSVGLRLPAATGREELVSYPPFIMCVRTGVVSVRVLGAAAAPQTLQPVVGDLQDEAAVHHAVGRLQVAMGDDDAVVEKLHPLGAKTTNPPLPGGRVAADTVPALIVS